MELVAQDPLIESPVAFDWGADGKFWVVEMRDYPKGSLTEGDKANGGCNNGRVVFLEDIHGDGVYDKSTIFLEGLSFPNSVFPWRNGVIVSADGEIFYAEATNGNGKASVHETILAGFTPGNPQHRLNGFEYGLDNWVYAANGDDGGRIHLPGSKIRTPMGSCDLRFQPDTGQFDLQAGCTQYGRHRDDWGNWFGDHNVTWLWHYFAPLQYLARNHQLFAAALTHETADYPDHRRVFLNSPMYPRFNEPWDTNQVTSACSPYPYRDELFGPDFEHSVFICDPAHNLVHREVLEPDGVTFRSHRAADEQTNEFLSSTDPWFRPVMAKTGP
jgi:putative membrane-bound dehydrogenase-like protein